MGPLPLSPNQLVISGLLVVIAIALSRAYRIGLEVGYAWGTVRTVAQLLMVGYVLRWIFAADAILYVALVFAVMLGVGAWTASRRTEKDRPKIPRLLSVVALAMALGCGLTTLAVTAFVVRADPWWSPRYFLPLAGMIIGNSMNAAALAAERLQAEVALREREIEEILALGATPRQAVDPALRAALRAALIPLMNSMLTVGIVALPGMMTGQMVAGAEPTTAANYQIVVMFMLAAATTISAVVLGQLIYRRFFTAAWQLRAEVYRSE